MKNLFSGDEISYYQRQLSLTEIGEKGQSKLKAARVLCIGAGGLGSAVLPYLAAAGIGTIGIVDYDVVEASNLHRQPLYTFYDLGKNKVDIAKSRLQEINPFITVHAYNTKLNHNNALNIIQYYDIVLDCCDNFITRYIANDACFYLRKAFVYASISRFTGQCSVFVRDKSPCYRCLFPEPAPSGLMPDCAEGGVLGVLPGVMGMLQVNQVIKLVAEIGNPVIGRLLQFNALETQLQEIGISVRPYCILCHYQQPFELLPNHEDISCISKEAICEISVEKLQDLLLKKQLVQLIDVRDEEERRKYNIGGTHIPLNELSSHLSLLDKRRLTVVYCKIGYRGREAVNLLKKSGFDQAYNLTGGIIAYNKKFPITN